MCLICFFFSLDLKMNKYGTDPNIRSVGWYSIWKFDIWILLLFYFIFLHIWDPPRNRSHSPLNKAGDTLAVWASQLRGVSVFYFGSHLTGWSLHTETRVSGALEPRGKRVHAGNRTDACSSNGSVLWLERRTAEFVWTEVHAWAYVLLLWHCGK